MVEVSTDMPMVNSLTSYLFRSLPFTYLDPFSSHIYSLGAIYDGFWKDQKKEGRGFYKWITGENQ